MRTHGFFTGLKQLNDERVAKGQKAEAMQRQRTLDDMVMRDRTAERERQARLDERQSGMDARSGEMHSLELRLKQAELERMQRPAPLKPAPMRQTDRGIEEFDGGTGQWGPTGRQPYQAPTRPRPPLAPRPQPASDKDKVADFMLEGAERAVRTLSGYAASPRTWVNKVPGLGNYGQTETDQVAQQAAETLHDAYLRITTGATVQPDELRRAALQYVAQPGDGPQVLRAKATRRAEILRAIRSAASRVRGGIAAQENDGDDLEAGLPNP